MPGKNSVKRSETFPRYADKKWADEEQQYTNGNQEVHNDQYDSAGAEGSRDYELEDDRRSKSSLDLRSGDESPHLSRRKKLMNRFRRFRSRSREKKKLRETQRQSAESEMDVPLTPANQFNGHNDPFDSLFDQADRRANGEQVQTKIYPKPGDEYNRNDANERYMNGDSKESRSNKRSTSYGENGTEKENGEEATKSRSRSRSASRNDLNSTGKLKRSGSRKSFRSPMSKTAGDYFDKAKTISKDLAGMQDAAPAQEHPFYHLKIHLKEGKDLKAMDSGGTSDPYAKLKLGGKTVYKSRTIMKTLNAAWNEKISLPIEDVQKVVRLLVYDYDRGVSDDCMGVADIDPTSFELNVPTDIKLVLAPEKKSSKKKELGYVLLQCTLIPKTQEDLDKYIKWSNKDGQKKVKTQAWTSVVNVTLVSGHDLEAMDSNGFADPYVKLKLGEEKFKSKTKPSTLNPKFLENCDLRMFDDQTKFLEVSVFDHDNIGKDGDMGHALIDLSDLEWEVTHTIDQELEGGTGYIKMLISISALACIDPPSDLSLYKPDPKVREEIVKKYSIPNTPKAMKDIGWLQVKVLRADGLASADLNGKSDPFCVVELVNCRVQTHTEYKTLTPTWEKIFNLAIKDIHAKLEVSVYDEDMDKKMEFLGKVVIPLFRIHKGVQRWYTLKDKNAICRKKGAVLLEMDYEYNPIRAALRTVNPMEKKYVKNDVKFKLGEMKRNIDRLAKLGEAAAEGGVQMGKILNWDTPPLTILAFIGFLIGVWTFELYLAPLGITCMFLGQMFMTQVVGHMMKDKDSDEYVNEDDDDDDDDNNDEPSKPKKKGQEEKMSFREKLQEIQDICLQVQEGLDMAASMGERVKNTVNFTVPYLSYLALIACAGGTVVLYFVPLRVLILLFGINKFTKTLRKGRNFKDNNELMDFISRVPSDKELIMYRELKPDSSIVMPKRKIRK